VFVSPWWGVAVNKQELVKLARELHSIHGLLPVPVTGKIPLGGTGWNTFPLEIRLNNILAPECTGVGVQLGFTIHPVLGPIEVRCVDCDIDDNTKALTFANTLNTFFHPTHWRWGRRPATLIITQPGVIKQEKFGPVQLLGEGKQVVWWGNYHNKTPLPNDPTEYWHQGASIFDQMPPFVFADVLRTGLEASVAAAGFALRKSMLIEAVPLSAADLAMLTLENLNEFKADIKSMLFYVDNMPAGSGRGTKLFSLGLKYGALIKASGTAPMLTDAMYQVCKNITEYESIDNPILAEIGQLADETFGMLPGSLGQGDQRDFARGVGASMGLAQNVAVLKAKQPLPMPSGRGYPAETVEDLMHKTFLPQKFLVNRFLPDAGCIVFAGKPKIGKGWIILELALSIAEGNLFWGEQCQHGEVLMYMLEDSERRIQERIKLLRPKGFSAGRNMKMRYGRDGPFYVNADDTGTLLDDIRANLQTFPSVRLVVIDVLQQVRGKIERTDNAYQMDYKVVASVQRLAWEFNVLILVVHHTKKGKVDDAIDSINGSFGVSGAADGAIIIGKEGDVVKIESRMRDILEFDFEMIKEGTNPMWKPAQTAAELFLPGEGTKTREVVMALHTAACCLTAGDISVRTGISEKNVATYLMRMMKSNQVNRPSRGFYMATGLPYRERIAGVINLLKRCPKTPATDEIKAQYAPNGVPPEVTYMILTPVAIKEIEAGFVDGKDCLNSLRLRGLVVTNSDTTWLLGHDWGETWQPMQSTPFTFKMPWEA
jgi:hypothetical protein